jgi:CRISPR-associated endonuclease/helicase Cas3
MHFQKLFEQLTGNPPFPWQEALYQRFISDVPNNIPSSCKLPTGLGKTSVVAVWLLALATQPNRIPRRLVYVVNRRTVVDQTTLEVEKYRRALIDQPGLNQVRERLAKLFRSRPAPGNELNSPLALSTLRGQFADNREWSFDPSRPSVICGTVDMIGSRLLFSGYGIGFKSKPLHAGFLGQDVLLVHDEAHLEPAFQRLLETIVREQEICEEFGSFRVMSLTATPRKNGDVFALTPADSAHEIVNLRVNAKKSIVLHSVVDEKKVLSERIVELCQRHKDSGKAILVFVRTIETLNAVVAALQKSKCSAQQLSGTLRGLERNRMADPRKADACPIFARFLPRPSTNAPASEQWKVVPIEGTVYLVCTSAGEVGVNLSADHLVCDLSPLDSMAQRFGRVNRFGICDNTQIDIVVPTKFESQDYDVRRERTLQLIRQLDGSGSPNAIASLDPDASVAAFTPEPKILDSTDFLFDSWALTTIRDKMPGRPIIAPYLHGIAEWQPEQTQVAWREEVQLLAREFATTYEKLQFQKQAAEGLINYPLKNHELLADRSDRVLNALKKLSVNPLIQIWLLDDDGQLEIVSLREAVSKDKVYLEAKTVLLPPEAGGLENGSFTGTAEFDANRDDYDVADLWFNIDGEQLRQRVWDDQTTPARFVLVDKLDTWPPNKETDEDLGRRYRLRFALRPEGSRNSSEEVTLSDHVDGVIRFASEIVEGLFIDEAVKNAVIVAAKFHDLGKRRSSFQRLLGNFDNQPPLLAKSGPGNLRNRLKEDYRHEFGSLVDIQSEPNFAILDRASQDLVLHLVATHHGFGRPHFPVPFDPENNDVDDLASEVPKRFARLQRMYGRWGLAYIESLLRAADWAASAEELASAGKRL